MTAITAIMAVVIMNWSQGIEAPKIPGQITIHITRHDRYNGTITIIGITPPGTNIGSFRVSNESDDMTAEGQSLYGFGTDNSSMGGELITVGDTQTAVIFGKFDEHVVITASIPSGDVPVFNSDV